MAAIGKAAADALLARAALVGVTATQIAELVGVSEYNLDVMSGASLRAAERLVRDAEDRARAVAGTATDRQVEYIIKLLIDRVRSGEGGGFASTKGLYTPDGTIDRAAVTALTKAQASQLITSLTGSY